MVSTDLTSPKSNPKSDSSKRKALEAIVANSKMEISVLAPVSACEFCVLCCLLSRLMKIISCGGKIRIRIYSLSSDQVKIIIGYLSSVVFLLLGLQMIMQMQNVASKKSKMI